MNNISANPISEYFRPYPAYEDVFYDDIENHKKHFLPVCSVNLKFLFPERDEWVHFISAKQDNLGYHTSDIVTPYTYDAMYSFDIIDGKYKFEAPWEYFWINRQLIVEKERKIIEAYEKMMPEFISDTENGDWSGYNKEQEWYKTNNIQGQLKKDLSSIFYHFERAKANEKNAMWELRSIERIKRKYYPEYFKELADTYEKATKSFELGKQFYEKYGHIYPRVLSLFKGDFADLENNYHEFIAKNPNFKENLPEYFGFITDIKAQSNEAKKFNPNGFPNKNDMLTPIHYNIWEHPMRKRKQFEYMGCITEYYFRYAGATVLNAFHDYEAKKASMLLDFD